MRRLLALPLFALTLAGCPSYDSYAPLVSQKGLAAAIEACRSDAPALASEVGRANQLEIGRTSHRVRNPANAPET